MISNISLYPLGHNSWVYKTLQILYRKQQKKNHYENIYQEFICNKNTYNEKRAEQHVKFCLKQKNFFLCGKIVLNRNVESRLLFVCKKITKIIDETK